MNLINSIKNLLIWVQNNLDPEARIGRLQTYNADAFESLYSVFHSNEAEENGTDGNIFDAD